MGLVSSTQSNFADDDNGIQKTSEKSMTNAKVTRLLLCGPGETGKTTILRQMMIKNKLEDSLIEQGRGERGILCFNVIEGAHLVLNFCAEAGRTSIENPSEKARLEKKITLEDSRNAGIVRAAYNYHKNSATMCTLNPKKIISASGEEEKVPDGPEIVDAVTHLYTKCAFFQRALGRRHKFGLYDNWEYFAKMLSKYPSWGGENWIPSSKDLLMSRCRTTGQKKFVFNFEGSRYQLIDTGGQDVERKKMSSLCREVDVVFFVVSMSDYNEVCFENINKKRFEHSIRCWQKFLKESTYKDTNIILIFNKMDLFKKKYYKDKIRINPKIKTEERPPKWEDEESSDCENAKKWFKDIYMNEVDPNKKEPRVYFTSALEEEMDYDSLEKVMEYGLSYVHHHSFGDI